jgi:predicted AlkP superfamily pyrophosphatase or phosphodiesterase
MRTWSLRVTLAFLSLLLVLPTFAASAYDHRPRLVVILVIDQFRGDYLERWRSQFGPNGFRMLMERGAWFTECYYDYANLRTAPGHATLGTGAYTNGHGIMANDWYDEDRNGIFASVKDKDFKVVGVSQGDGVSPRNLLATTFGDELKLATQGRSRVFGIALKNHSAVLPVGHTADAAFWIDKDTGLWVTSTYYRKDGTLPGWAQKFNDEKHNEKYWGLEFKDSAGKVLRTTARGQKDIDGSPLDFYETIGRTPFATDYTFEFARALITSEALGKSDTTDLLSISISGYDILGHKVGPDSPQQAAETLALDRQLAEFLAFLGRQIGMENVWIALSADHGVAPLPEAARSVHASAVRFDVRTLTEDLNAALFARYPGALTKVGGSDPNARTQYFVKASRWPQFFLSQKAFAAEGVKEADAERLVGELVTEIYDRQLVSQKLAPSVDHVPPRIALRGFVTRAQMEAGLPNAAADPAARRFVHSYSPLGGWYLAMEPPPLLIAHSSARYAEGTDHGLGYSYDRHVPLVFFGAPFKPGIYRTASEPVDLAVTLSSLLGLNHPSHAVGRVLVEALQ